MAITANGMIAKEDGNSDWVSDADNKSWKEICQKAGAVIMGRKTLEILYPDSLPLKRGKHVVLSHHLKTVDNPTVTFTDQSITDILANLEKSGLHQVCVIGGQMTATEFMSSSLVDEIYLDVEPLIFGKGMGLFSVSNFEFSLELLEVKNLSPQTVQLHYKVIQSS